MVRLKIKGIVKILLTETVQEIAVYSGELLFRVIPVLVAALIIVETARYYLGEERLSSLLTGKSVWGARGRAAFLGALLPFCECGAFPVGVALIKAGVPVSAVLTFFLISPVISIPAFFLLGGLFGLPFAVFYAFITISGGITAALLIEKTGLAPVSVKLEASGGNSNTGKYTLGTAQACNSGCDCKPEPEIDKRGESKNGKESFLYGGLRKALSQVLSTLKSILPYLLVAVVVAGTIKTLIPPETVEGFLQKGGAAGVPLAALLGIPVYQGDCAMISIVAPIIKATGLVGPGAAFIIAGTGTSINGVILLNALFHKKFMVAYLSSIVIIAVITGYILQLIN